MATTRSASVSSTSMEQQTAEMKGKIRELSLARDLPGLAAVAEMSLRELRMLCERPVTCAELGEMLDTLERLNLDDWETSESEE